MQLEDMVLVSVDDHVVEPPDVFERTLPAKWQDRAPKVVEREDGTFVWRFEGIEVPNIGLNAVAGRPREEYGVEPTSYDEMRPGCFDIGERIKDMNAAGVLGSLCFPSFPGFAGRLFAACDDKEIALALVKAYNDWHVGEWCGAAPGRFIPLALPVIWDPVEAGKEVHRMADAGCHAVTFPENPVPLNYPSLHSDHWDPFWRACEERGTVICMHIGSSSKLVVTADDAPIDVLITLQPMAIVNAAGDVVWSRVVREFPGIKIALSEGGTGWVPYFLDRIDRTYDMHHFWTGQDFGDLRPSDVFRRNLLTCFIDDPVGIQVRHKIGMDNICWEMDYPHSDSTWPQPAEQLWKALDGVPDDEIDKITHLNAMRWFSYDPFSVRPKEQCTVGALRAEAAGHDVTIRARGKRESADGVVRAGGLAKKATA